MQPKQRLGCELPISIPISMPVIPLAKPDYADITHQKQSRTQHIILCTTHPHRHFSGNWSWEGGLPDLEIPPKGLIARKAVGVQTECENRSRPMCSWFYFHWYDHAVTLHRRPLCLLHQVETQRCTFLEIRHQQPHRPVGRARINLRKLLIHYNHPCDAMATIPVTLLLPAFGQFLDDHHIFNQGRILPLQERRGVCIQSRCSRSPSQRTSIIRTPTYDQGSSSSPWGVPESGSHTRRVLSGSHG